MKKNKKILCMVISGCVLLASAVTITGMGKMYSKAFAEGSEVSSDRDNQTPPNGTPPEGTPPNGAPSGGGKTPPDGQGGGVPGENASASSSYSAVNSYTEDTEVSDQTISSTGSDENAVLVQNGANVTMNNITLDRTSSDSTGGDNASFYGVGAGMLVTDGVLNVRNSTINTDSAGGTGVFAYGSGTVNVENTTIHTTQDTSGGIHAAGGGTLNAANLTCCANLIFK